MPHPGRTRHRGSVGRVNAIGVQFCLHDQMIGITSITQYGHGTLGPLACASLPLASLLADFFRVRNRVCVVRHKLGGGYVRTNAEGVGQSP